MKITKAIADKNLERMLNSVNKYLMIEKYKLANTWLCFNAMSNFYIAGVNVLDYHIDLKFQGQPNKGRLIKAFKESDKIIKTIYDQRNKAFAHDDCDHIAPFETMKEQSEHMVEAYRYICKLFNIKADRYGMIQEVMPFDMDLCNIIFGGHNEFLAIRHWKKADSQYMKESMEKMLCQFYLMRCKRYEL